MSEPLELALSESPENRRDYRTESRNSRIELASRMAQLREARLKPSPEVIVTAQFLIFMGLPNRSTTEHVIRKSTRMGDGSQIVVTFTAMNEGVGLPFGSDVNMLHWMIDRAIQTGSPFVSWETAQEYLTWMNLSKGGRTLKELRARFERIAGLAITVQRTDSTAVETFVMPIVRASRLPRSVRQQKNGTGLSLHVEEDERKNSRPRGLMFDESFFKDFIAHNVPMLKAFLLLVSERPQLQQYIGFLGWRSWAAASATLIPWANLREQIWHGDSNERRIKQRFKETIQALRIAWPELQAEARPNGLWIAPPLKGIQFIPSLPVPSRRIPPDGSTPSLRLPDGAEGLSRIGDV
jgi:Plasmid encoded RepA protein